MKNTSSAFALAALCLSAPGLAQLRTPDRLPRNLPDSPPYSTGSFADLELVDFDSDHVTDACVLVGDELHVLWRIEGVSEITDSGFGQISDIAPICYGGSGGTDQVLVVGAGGTRIVKFDNDDLREVSRQWLPGVTRLESQSIGSGLFQLAGTAPGEIHFARWEPGVAYTPIAVVPLSNVHQLAFVGSDVVARTDAGLYLFNSLGQSIGFIANPWPGSAGSVTGVLAHGVYELVWAVHDTSNDLWEIRRYSGSSLINSVQFAIAGVANPADMVIGAGDCKGHGMDDLVIQTPNALVILFGQVVSGGFSMSDHQIVENVVGPGSSMICPARCSDVNHAPHGSAEIVRTDPDAGCIDVFSAFARLAAEEGDYPLVVHEEPEMINLNGLDGHTIALPFEFGEEVSAEWDYPHIEVTVQYQFDPLAGAGVVKEDTFYYAFTQTGSVRVTNVNIGHRLDPAGEVGGDNVMTLKEFYFLEVRVVDLPPTGGLRGGGPMRVFAFASDMLNNSTPIEIHDYWMRCVSGCGSWDPTTDPSEIEFPRNPGIIKMRDVVPPPLVSASCCN